MPLLQLGGKHVDLVRDQASLHQPVLRAYHEQVLFGPHLYHIKGFLVRNVDAPPLPDRVEMNPVVISHPGAVHRDNRPSLQGDELPDKLPVIIAGDEADILAFLHLRLPARVCGKLAAHRLLRV